MKLGVDDRKKVGMLGALVLVGGYLFYSTVISSPGSGSAPAPASATRPEIAFPATASTSGPAPARTVPRSRLQTDEFHPVLRSKRPEDRIDPAKVDPTLRLDLLAKLQVEPSGNGRNLFQFGPPPAKAAPPKPEPTIIPKPGPVPPVTTTSQTVAPPAPSPIPLRYYGFSSVPSTSAKTAFFLDGDEILVAKEGDTVKRRYRVVRIGASSVVVEDTESKRQQTLQMEPIAG